MKTFRAKVLVTLKSTVNDPQGLTIQGGLHSLGFASVKSVRFGKYLEILLEGESPEAVRAQVEEMCRKLLANPVIEQFRYEVEETG